MDKIVVAVDGPAGSGKSTITRLAALKTGFLYIDTGAMYRAITLKVLEKGINTGDKEEVEKICRNTNISFKKDGNNQRVLLDKRDVTEDIRDRKVTKEVSLISSYKGVRDVLVRKQREYAKKYNVIMEGRDIGTVVFPDAAVKIYLDASVEERAKRRYNELKEKKQKADYQEILNKIKIRDEKDSTREISPLKKAEDVIVVDTTDLNIDEVITEVISIIEEKLSGLHMN